MKLPSIKLGPKPKTWDLIAAALIAVAVAVATLNWLAAQRLEPGVSLSGGTTFAFALVQVIVTSSSLMVLGKTAKEGTLWGNLAAVGGLFLGLSGVLLAAALWVAA